MQTRTSVALVVFATLAAPVGAALTLTDPYPLTDAVEALYAYMGIPAPDRAPLELQEHRADRVAPGLAAAAARILRTGLDPAATPAELLQAAQHVTRLVPRVDHAADQPDLIFVDVWHFVVLSPPLSQNVYEGNNFPGNDAVLPPQWQALTIDLGGHDVYRNTAGGALAFVDAEAADPVRAAPFSVSIDLFTDLEGDDVYDCRAWGCTLPSHGAAAGPATGILLDMGGDDQYLAGDPLACCYGGYGTLAQGAAADGGTAYFQDRGGHDVYMTERGLGHARNGATAAFLDTTGDDHYLLIQGLATAIGGPLPAGGEASFADLGVGRDVYQVPSWWWLCDPWSQQQERCTDQSAGGVALATHDNCATPATPPGPCPDIEARFLDDGGDDVYAFPRHVPSLGVGSLHAPATFLDLGGVDDYGNHRVAANNAPWTQGTVPGFLGVDVGGAGFDSDVVLDRTSPVHAIANRIIDAEDPSVHWCIVLVVAGDEVVANATTSLLQDIDPSEQPEECERALE